MRGVKRDVILLCEGFHPWESHLLEHTISTAIDRTLKSQRNPTDVYTRVWLFRGGNKRE